MWTQLRQVSCSVLLSPRSFTPCSDLEVLRKVSAVWFLLSVYFSRWRIQKAYFICAGHSDVLKGWSDDLRRSLGMYKESS